MMTSRLNRLRTVFLSPNSQFELGLRTMYHKINATRVVFAIHNWMAERSYRRLLAQQAKQSKDALREPGNQPKISFVLSCSQAEIADATATLKSIINLHGSNWDVILISPQKDLHIDDNPDFNQDERIKQVEISQESILNAITGDYVLFCKAGDQFFESLLIHFYQSLSASPPPDLTYYDCEYQDEHTSTCKPFFKPTIISPALMLSVNYLSRGFIKRGVLRKFLDEIHPDTDLLSQEYALALRLCENNNTVHHIPSVLVSQKTLSKPDHPELQKPIVEHLTSQELEKVSFKEHSHGSPVKWKTNNPTIAIVIPSKNNHKLLKPLLESIFKHTNKYKYAIQIVDNGSDDEATLAFYRTLNKRPNVSILPYLKPFNYSEAINLGVAETDSDLVLLMNDDMAVKTPDWLSELTQWVIRPEVGVVGAKLLRANHTIQHAGIILGLTGFMGHIYLNAPDHYAGLMGSVDWYRNFLAVTGACQMIRREVFNLVGGYDEGYQLAFGDIDFCIRVHQQGYQNVYTPFAEIIHYEGESRGYITPVADVLRGYEKMEKYLLEEDPYFSPNLTYTRIPKCLLRSKSTEERSQQIDERKKFYIQKK
jgi:O-antigen biosynthesis protein